MDDISHSKLREYIVDTLFQRRSACKDPESKLCHSLTEDLRDAFYVYGEQGNAWERSYVKYIRRREGIPSLGPFQEAPKPTPPLRAAFKFLIFNVPRMLYTGILMDYSSDKLYYKKELVRKIIESTYYLDLSDSYHELYDEAVDKMLSE
jgi:hypothetical protein